MLQIFSCGVKSLVGSAISREPLFVGHIHMSDSDIPKTLGALLIGGLFASLLGGTVNLQTVLYFRAYQKDRAFIKVCSLFGEILRRFGFYPHHATTKFDHLDSISWCIALTVILTAIVTFLVHCFFAHRMFLLSRRNWFMSLPVLGLALVRLAAASATTSKMLEYRNFTLFQLHVRWLFTLGLAVSSALDVLITALLVYLFQSSRTESGRLIRHGLETGSLTCVITIVTMICWIIAPQNLIFLGIYLVIGKFYATSLLVTLNSRVSMHKSVPSSLACDQRTPVVFNLETRSQKTTMARSGSSHSKPTALEINIETQTNVRYDSERLSTSSG
ncbi:hypothetical protein FB45DRAFT_7244 [Roridomyces roridus]|uniref:DUF6534 domain-containing protein n=1 Tax=Roridomyces roridus TaxID=1738132 RepID=A0AAD7FY68_9AGAR|nr:hypothetical protein FB45DRAFT_7244 [Roridomyces roridus]